MANFLLTYHGEGGMPTTAEETAKVMAVWGACYGQLGEAVVDPGNPTSHSKATSNPARACCSAVWRWA